MIGQFRTSLLRVIVVLLFSASVAFYGWMLLRDTLGDKFSNTLFAGFLGGAVLAGGLLRIFMRRSLSEAYAVAILGFPRSGKTTLITSLFDEIWKGQVGEISANPIGQSTIERLNKDLATLKKGRALAPTTDQDKFSYTANVRRRSLLGERKLKVEFGDFPGEDTQDFAEEFGIWIHKTPFFNWAMTADAFVFVIDIGRWMTPVDSPEPTESPGVGNYEYIAEISNSYRAAWQHILEYHEERSRGVSGKAIVLAFTKADLFTRMSREFDGIGSKRSVLEKLAFGERTPPVVQLERDELEVGESAVLSDFDDLIHYLNSECKQFEVVFTSSFGLEGGARVGAAKFLKAVLPL